MQNLLIFGSIGLDDIKTPFGRRKNILGGSASYSAYAASFFVRNNSLGIISIIGADFPKKYLKLFKNRDINLEGISQKNKTFRWQASYEFDMNEAKSLKTDLNCLKNYLPSIPKNYSNASYLFLANSDPRLQLQVLKEIKKPKITLIDTMDGWIKSQRQFLIKAINKSNILLLNEWEARELFNTPNIIKAGRLGLQMGPEYVIIKKGEHGALLFSHHSFFSAPAYPLEDLIDPTGAGDSFAGAFIGYLAKTDDLRESNIRKAIIYGSAMASFCSEDFSLERLKLINLANIKERYNIFNKIKEF